MIRLLALLVLIVSCGPSKSEGEKEAVSANDTSASLVMTAADLPPCDEGAKGKLIYIKETSEFRYCSGSAWSFINIKGSDGKDGLPSNAVVAQWEFNTEGYQTTPTLVTDQDTPMSIFLGSIQISVLYDKSMIVMVSGIMLSETFGDDQVFENFAHSFIIPGQKQAPNWGTPNDYAVKIKISSHNKMHAMYAVKFKEGTITPEFKAHVNTNEYTYDDEYIDFHLTKVDLENN